MDAGQSARDQEEIVRLRRELDGKKRELKDQATEIATLRAELAQQKQLVAMSPNPPSALALEASFEDLDKLIMSDIGQTPRLSVDSQRGGGSGFGQQVAPPVVGGCAKCERLEAALASTEAALSEVYDAYIGVGPGAGDGDSALETLVNEIAQRAAPVDSAGAI